MYARSDWRLLGSNLDQERENLAEYPRQIRNIINNHKEHCYTKAGDVGPRWASTSSSWKGSEELEAEMGTQSEIVLLVRDSPEESRRVQESPGNGSQHVSWCQTILGDPGSSWVHQKMENRQISNPSPLEFDDESDTFLTDKERQESSDADQGVVAASSPATPKNLYRAWRRKKRVILLAIGVGVVVIGLYWVFYNVADNLQGIFGEERSAKPAFEEWVGTPQTAKEWSEEESHWRAYNWTAPDIDESLKRMITNLSSVCLPPAKLSMRALGLIIGSCSRMMSGRGSGYLIRGLLPQVQ